MRTIIDLPEEQLDWLARICKRDRISRAEAIRRMIEEARHRERNADWEAAARATFGMLKDNPIDALAWEDELRDESGR